MLHAFSPSLQIGGKSYDYLYFRLFDGLGFQLRLLDCVMSYTYHRCKVTYLFDLRDSCYFSGTKSMFDQRKMDDIFSLKFEDPVTGDSRILSNTCEIDKIIQSSPEKVAAVFWDPRPFEEKKFAKNKIDILYYENLVSPLVKEPLKFLPDTKNSVLSKALRLGGRLTESLKIQEKKAKNKVGVHARLGNGENLGWFREKFPVTSEDFFRKLDSISGDFFVCTDTHKFLQECVERYGKRVFFSDRFMFPDGTGPGHRTFSGLTIRETDLLRQMRQKIGPYQLIHDALLDMVLLSFCNRLIGNFSNFSYYATQAGNIAFENLANSSS